jgi:hypothetical protein
VIAPGAAGHWNVLAIPQAVEAADTRLNYGSPAIGPLMTGLPPSLAALWLGMDRQHQPHGSHVHAYSAKASRFKSTTMTASNHNL